jgi:uncharacterized protein with PQ loop repeat
MNIVPFLEYELLGNLGILATLIGVISFIPILTNIYKTKQTNNFTHSNILLAIIGNSLWIIFGIYNKVNSSFFMGSIYLLIYLSILYFKIYFP